MKPKWRFIESGPGDAFYNMALDEALATIIRKSDGPPTLRLYSWEKPSLTLGCFQKTTDINLQYCLARNIPVVRRPTGGRAVLHAKELTYSFSAKTDKGLFATGLLDSYSLISEALSLAFQKIGLPVTTKKEREKGRVLSGSPLCFQSGSFGELLIDGRKLVGSAQKRWPDGLLQQGSVPYSYGEKVLKDIFGTERTAGLKTSMISIYEALPDFREELLRDALVSAFEEVFGINLLPEGPVQEEALLAQELLQEKYLRPHWNFPHDFRQEEQEEESQGPLSL